ncbi:restriction endonuclease subunit S [Marinomonas polaris]|uniref:restriction endonuclease subunit S n=1 Tax=Marinomonas polaris TaxID=293552 RepID=UPI003511CEA8
MSSVTRRKLGDITDSCLGKMLDKEKNKGAFHPYLANYNVRWGEFDLSNVQEMKFENHEHERYGLKYGDLVICEGGEPGRCAVWRDNVPDMKIQKALHRLRVKSGFSYDFLYYRILLANRTSELQKYFIGSTIKHLTGVSLKQVEFNFPCHEEQVSIATVLRSLDKKIELNNRINSELEAMAKTLYNYWFVQFDFPDDSPQGQGKPYKTSGGKMVYNPTLKREIPEGWEVAPLSSISGVSNESVNPADFPEKLFKHFSIPVFDATNTFGVERGDTIGSNKFTVKETDLLVSKLNPWFNRVVYAMGESEQICSTEFVVWRCPNPSIKNFMYMIATSPQFIAHCTQSATGTSNSHKRVNPNVMMRFDQPFNLKVAEKLGQHLEPILKQLIVNQRENTKLAQLRDWLLPMLMNGQVTVK